MAIMRVSTALLAQMIGEHWPLPDGTEIEAVEDYPYEVAFNVKAPGVILEEVVPVMQKDSDGVVSFVKWMQL